jgi:hypothetical protein
MAAPSVIVFSQMFKTVLSGRLVPDRTWLTVGCFTSDILTVSISLVKVAGDC